MLLTTKGFKKPELGDIADLRTFVGDNMDLLETELDKKSDTTHTHTDLHTHSNKASLDLVSGTNTGNETTTSIGTLINGATAKTTPVDADMVGLMDSAASNILKKLSWANIKATLKTYFDTLYNNYTHPTYTYTTPVDDTNTTLTSVDFVSTITQTNGHVTGGTKRNLVAGTNVSIVAEVDGDVVISATTGGTYTASNGVTLVGSDFQHVDTSTQASVNNSGRTYIQDITLDGFGHITGIASATETVVDTNTTYDISAVTTTGGALVRLTAGGSGSGTDDVKLASGANVTVTYTDANTITINATDTNTTYTGSNGVLLSGTDFQHADTSTQASLTALTGANVVSDIDVDGFGHVTLLATRALTAGDIGAATSGHTHATLAAGNGLTGTSYDGSTGQTFAVASAAGTAGSVGTLTITADAVGVTLGTTSTTAYRGDYGNTAYTHSQTTHAPSDADKTETAISGATAKVTPVDADTMPLSDSAATNAIKKVTWANIKSTLKTYFDTVYSLSGHNHNGTYQAADADLTAIAGLAGTTGLLKKTAADTWTLDTTAYTTNTGTVTSIATSGAITGGTITSSGTISHSTSDGYLHVPATSTTNNGKALIAGGTAGSFAWTTLTATMVGLGNVTNESKATMFTSPTFTGTPLSTTATVGTNTTQIATTAFVNAEIANDAAPIAHVGSTGSAHGIATTLVDGFMSSTDKTKLDGIATGATANTGTVTSISAGNGMTFTTITGSGSVTMGTPTGLTATTTNSVSANTHSHAISTGSAIGLSNASTNTTGTATSLSRSDHTHAITGFSLDGHTHTDLHTHSNKLVLDKFSEVGGNVLYNGSSISPANLTLTELTLGSRFKISYNLSTDSLDFGVI